MFLEAPIIPTSRLIISNYSNYSYPQQVCQFLVVVSKHGSQDQSTIIRYYYHDFVQTQHKPIIAVIIPDDSFDCSSLFLLISIISMMDRTQAGEKQGSLPCRRPQLLRRRGGNRRYRYGTAAASLKTPRPIRRRSYLSEPPGRTEPPLQWQLCCIRGA